MGVMQKILPEKGCSQGGLSGHGWLIYFRLPLKYLNYLFR